VLFPKFNEEEVNVADLLVFDNFKVEELAVLLVVLFPVKNPFVLLMLVFTVELPAITLLVETVVELTTELTPPKYSKENPRPKHIELKRVIEIFNKN
jgi:hypothetical protein